MSITREATWWTGRAALARNLGVSVPTAHKILIGTAIAFFLLYAFWELGRYAESGEASALAWSAAASAVAIGLVVYLRRFVRSLGTRVPNPKR